MKTSHVLRILNLSVFLKNHIFLLPVLYLFYTAQGLTLGDFFLLQGIATLCCLLFDIPMGWLADRFSKKKILIFSGILLAFRFLLLYLYPTKTIIFICEILYALVIVSYVGTADSYIYELLKKDHKSQKMLKRYGRLYFYASCGVSFSSFVGGYLFDWFGVQVVIGITFIYTLVSAILLFFIPDIQSDSKDLMSLSKAYQNLYSSVRKSLKSVEMRYLVIYSAFLTASYQIFMWSMQPMMEQAKVSVGLFGVVFAMNHIARATGSYWAHKIMHYISLNRLGFITYFGFILSWISSIGIAYLPNPIVCLILLGFICLMIGLSVVYLISAIARIHDMSLSDTRALAASVNSMAGRFLTAGCLILSKFILDETSMQFNFCVFMILFLPSVIILRRFSQIQTK